MDRFWSKVRETRGCWRWTACHSTGYARFYLPGHKAVPAIRVAYELLVGPIPDGLELDHLCRNKWCVNPYHAEPVTHRENVKRAMALTKKKVCQRGHDLTVPENVYIFLSGKRNCKICKHMSKEQKEGVIVIKNSAPAGPRATRGGA